MIWYQGESNGGAGTDYQKLFPAMIQDWRVRFQQAYFPFLFVQLANYGTPTELTENTGCQFLREAQDLTLHLPHTGMATAFDLGNAYDPHPKNKKPVGYRLALQALNVVYEKKVDASGPRFQSVTFSSNEAIISFDFAEEMKTIDNLSPKSFCLAGEDRKFYKAKAIISGQTIILSCPEVANPKAVRYAWAQNPNINLYNKAQLPALPFRTDNW